MSIHGVFSLWNFVHRKSNLDTNESSRLEDGSEEYGAAVKSAWNLFFCNTYLTSMILRLLWVKSRTLLNLILCQQGQWYEIQFCASPCNVQQTFWEILQHNWWRSDLMLLGKWETSAISSPLISDDADGVLPWVEVSRRESVVQVRIASQICYNVTTKF